ASTELIATSGQARDRTCSTSSLTTAVACWRRRFPRVAPDATPKLVANARANITTRLAATLTSMRVKPDSRWLMGMVTGDGWWAWPANGLSVAADATLSVIGPGVALTSPRGGRVRRRGGGGTRRRRRRRPSSLRWRGRGWERRRARFRIGS